MTFAVRTITRSATGGDIVHRPQVLDASEVTVGRGTDCDIRLADLAVSLRHARLRQTGPGTLTAESIGTKPFEVGGRFTTKADLTLADNPRLTFGSHVLALSAGDEDDAVLVDVTRLETGPEVASAVNEDRIFSLTAARFGKRPMAWGLAAAALALCLAWPIVSFVAHSNRKIHADQQWSTGPLSRSHAFLSRNCQACHVKAFVSVRDETCLACHQATGNPGAAERVAQTERSWGGPAKVTLIRDHAAHDRLLQAMPLPASFTGKIQALFRRQFNHPNDRCASCHLEHLADAPVKGAAAGSRAAARRPRATPVLNVVTSCTGCHARLRENVDDARVQDTPDWGHHPEFRPLIARTPLGTAPPIVDRISLVERPSDYTGLVFSHREHLSPTGGVARMAAGLRFAGGKLQCADCHRPNGAGGFDRVEMTRDCSSCHSLAFAPGPGGAPRLLPHGRPGQVLAALTSVYGGGGGGGGAGSIGPRRPPGFLSRLASMVASPAHASENGVAAAKMRALFAPRGLCSECHAAIAPIDVSSLDYKVAPIHLTSRYLPWGAFDHGVPEHKRDAAGRPTCESCHAVANSAIASDVMLPRVSQCASCHGKTRAKIATAASADCAECHSYHAPGMATPKGELEPGGHAAAAVATARDPARRTLASFIPGGR